MDTQTEYILIGTVVSVVIIIIIILLVMFLQPSLGPVGVVKEQIFVKNAPPTTTVVPVN